MFAGNQGIFLRDNLAGVVTNLKLLPYQFSSVSGTYANRFEIVYQNSPLGVLNPELNPNSVVIFKKENGLHIDSGSLEMQSVQVFDVRGRLVYETGTIHGTKLMMEDIRVESEVLLVKITTATGLTISRKVVL
ncbi:MAG: hypothetical protein CFE23_12970 [Flavobacterium sp. BFFFF1]|nr:MAG: hypothetical protein CFE23_12970 [Flavobacterium sp. BFFFF1]